MVTRGCGQRVENGLYLTVPTSAFGMPLEYFLVDPALKWAGGTLRSPMIVPDPVGVNHLLLGIGKENYPAFTDFFEEAKRHGISKRVPRGFDPSRLEFGKSKFLLTHPRGIPQKPFHASHFKCPKGKNEHEYPQNDPKCVGGLWPLAGLIEGPKAKHEVLPSGGGVEKEGWLAVKTPSVEYPVPIVTEPDSMTYEPGVLLQFKIFRFEIVSKAGKVPDDLKGRFDKAGFSLDAVPE